MTPTQTKLDPLQLLHQHSHQVDQHLRRALNAHHAAPQPLLQAIQYSLMSGGKRLRPALLLESFQACHGSEESQPTALAAAAAIELVHTFSLVHDDLPAMDDDDLRRGQPTSHKVFGEALAILAGDAMVTMAFDLLASEAQPDLLSMLVKELAVATGPSGMIGGQVLDIQAQNHPLSLPHLQDLHRMKTGALLTAACRMGAIAAHAQQPMLAALTEFGRHVGLAFQIIDDLLDVTSTPQQLGKSTRKDAAKGKNTYPGLLGIDATRRQAYAEVQAAQEALSGLHQNAEGLRSLAQFIVQRQA
jgi:geranylgeranyl diphosphate synthase type II